jgi:heme oxygenase
LPLPIESTLDEQTRSVRTEAEAELASFFEVTTPEQYHRFLGRAYGFIAPLERSLLDTPDIDRMLDLRRFGKRLLIEHDLAATGLKLLEIQSLPQCMWIPWFEDVHTALGWAYIIERNTQMLPGLYRHLASTLPGEAAFGATYLKCYSGANGEMWASFVRSLERAIRTPQHLETAVAGAKAGYRFFRRWRSTLDGRALSGNHETIDDQPQVEVPVKERAASAPEDA